MTGNDAERPAVAEAMAGTARNPTMNPTMGLPDTRAKPWAAATMAYPEPPGRCSADKVGRDGVGPGGLTRRVLAGRENGVAGSACRPSAAVLQNDTAAIRLSGSLTEH